MKASNNESSTSISKISQADDTETKGLNLSIFSKHLKFLDYNSMSEAVAEMGFDGIDLTLRPNGHVLPERVEEDLPKVTEAMKVFGLKPNMICSNVKDATNPVDLKVLEVASALGYTNYRPDLLTYTDDKTVLQVVEDAKTYFAALETLNKKFEISGSYINLPGQFFGSAIWDLHSGLNGLNPKYIGSQYDITHASIEGGTNWEVGFKLIAPHINTLVIKDYKWTKKNGQWNFEYTPLGEGMVDFKRFFTLLKTHNINVPISIHTEYDLGGAERGETPNIAHKDVFNRIKKDVVFVRELWEEV
ncbi:xylose isomerase-like TIM barrel domain protein [Formosa agariphila KMM 3901]|uniref:Xylose isomerase-like TIM barrel domain protein n=1 Tax=Formosa agariphila (strain DSM 15362 / KCTC 12365 / LMG 23005 / KMM 3901 / M-2Alg 35-1) TaxID=1347342 RepID=T2KK59_FORAG|nr:TIM barrel protein [Formosa agariphila]CDF78813.1 xylose isomerase-like TIM barrel domain protein [Formosa agariphila KMM 3901]